MVELVVLSIVLREASLKIHASSFIKCGVTESYDAVISSLSRLFEDRLVHVLILVRCILVYLLNPPILNFLDRLWLAQSRVEHSLVVANQSLFAIEQWAKVVLTLGKDVSFFHWWSSMWLASFTIVLDLWVLSQIVIECSFEASWLINNLETSCAITNIGISTSTIVSIINWFGMNTWHIITWSLFGNDKWTYKITVIKNEIHYIPTASIVVATFSGQNPPLVL